MGIRQKRSFDHSSIGTSKETCTMDLKVCLVLMFAIAMVAAAPAPVRRGKRRGRGARFSHRNAEFDRQPLRRYDEVDDERYDGPAWRRSSGFGHSGFGHSGFGHSGYGDSGYGNSGYGHSGYGHSGYGHSGYGHSGHGGAAGFGRRSAWRF